MKQYLMKLLEHGQLSPEETRQIMLNITREKYPEVQIAALLALIQSRGATPEEAEGFRQAMMETGLKVDLEGRKAIDIVGTGGDGKNTFNISTCTCFVVAGAGYQVAKHGNFSATSVSGASTVLQMHGVRFTADHAKLLESIDRSGVAFLHAPLFALAMKYVGPIRKSLGFPTVFNLLGPLINPAEPEYNMLGVANLELMRIYRSILSGKGAKFSLVNSLDGYDEISLTGDFKVSTPAGERIYSPSELGLPASRPEELGGGSSPEDAARIFDEVLEGRGGAARSNTVIANAAFAIHTIKPECPLPDCIAEARESLESGKALGCFRKFVEINS